MPWAKFDDQFPDHPKVIAAGPAAAWLFVCGVCYCARMLTDGFIPDGQVRKLADMDRTSEAAEALVEAGLWERVAGGFQVHDYLEYNPTAKKVKEEREKTKDRVNAWRHRNADCNAVTDGVSNAVSNTTPVPVPVPESPSRSRTTAIAVESATTRAGRGRTFQPPSLEEAREFMDTLDPPRGRCAEDFVDHFESNGWLVGGRTPMRSWQAAARRWARNEDKFTQPVRMNGTAPRNGGHTLQSMQEEIGQQLKAQGFKFDGE